MDFIILLKSPRQWLFYLKPLFFEVAYSVAMTNVTFIDLNLYNTGCIV